MGRICCDAEGKMNSSSVLLEGSLKTSGGQSVHLSLSGVEEYSLFPGQVQMKQCVCLHMCVCVCVCVCVCARACGVAQLV